MRYVSTSEYQCEYINEDQTPVRVVEGNVMVINVATRTLCVFPNDKIYFMYLFYFLELTFYLSVAASCIQQGNHIDFH